MRHVIALLYSFAALCSANSSAQPVSSQAGRTYCNPVDLNYQYNFEQLSDVVQVE